MRETNERREGEGRRSESEVKMEQRKFHRFNSLERDYFDQENQPIKSINGWKRGKERRQEKGIKSDLEGLKQEEKGVEEQGNNLIDRNEREHNLISVIFSGDLPFRKIFFDLKYPC